MWQRRQGNDVREINKKTRGDGHTCLNAWNTIKLLTLHKDELIDGNLNQSAKEVEYPLVPCRKYLDDINITSIYTFNVCSNMGRLCQSFRLDRVFHKYCSF